MTQEELEQKLQAQMRRVTHIKSCFEIWKGLHNEFCPKGESENVFLQSPYFWQITLKALQENFLMETAKLYDEAKDCFGLKKIINVCENSQGLFPKEHKRVLYNHFENKEIERLIPVDIAAVIQSANKEYNSVQDIRLKLITLRDKYLAHSDKKYCTVPEELYSEVKLSGINFERLISVAGEILNLFLIALTDRSDSYIHVASDDYKHLLLAVRNSIKKDETMESHEQQ